ncbi:MAG: hypothetical protein ACFFBV_04315 [Promethearchaeota archaeon]
MGRRVGIECAKLGLPIGTTCEEKKKLPSPAVSLSTLILPHL